MTAVIDAYLGLGSNLGDRLGNLADAVRHLAETQGIDVAAVSSVYESEPWGAADQDPYANCVVHVRTALYAGQLLEVIREIEAELGRVRDPAERYGPRTIDIDILLFGDEEWESDELTIPHPRMAERDFVIRPLLEIAPGVRYPDGGDVTGAHVSVGTVTGVLGTLPHLAEEEAAGLVGVGEEWVSIGEVGRYERPDMQPPADLLYKQAVLEGEGIPYTYDPYPPGQITNPWGLAPTIKLLVPASLESRARRVLLEAESAPKDSGGNGPVGP